MSGARKLAAILAVDIAGYSQLIGRGRGEDGEGGARAARKGAAHRAGLGGRLVKTTGDGLLLEFPSVVAAVECAILIQKMMAQGNAALPEAKRISYRIGLDLGDVLIDGDDILGDGVNVAARLEGICEPGGVCASGSAYEHIQGRVSADFADLGEQSLKNIARRVRAYALSPAAVAEARGARGRKRLLILCAGLRARRAAESSPLSSCPSPISAAIPNRTISSMA